MYQPIPLIISPLPAPNSIKLNFLGQFSFSQNEITQIAIISENNIDILGAVMKSPPLAKGVFFHIVAIFFIIERLLYKLI